MFKSRLETVLFSWAFFSVALSHCLTLMPLKLRPYNDNDNNNMCVCGKAVDACGLHGLSCRRSAPRQQRHSHLNDILWRAIKRAHTPAVKEPISLMRDDNKRPDGTTLLPWARAKPMAWEVTVPDRYAESHIGSTATKPGAAAHKTEQNKIDKILQIGQYTHLLPICHRDSWHMA